MMNFKYGHLVFSTNFDIEPVIEQYMKTYPDADLHNYQIVFKGFGEHHPDSRSYVIVYEYHPKASGLLKFSEFIKSYCTVHRLAVEGHFGGQIFPDITQALKRLSDRN